MSKWIFDIPTLSLSHAGSDFIYGCRHKIVLSRTPGCTRKAPGVWNRLMPRHETALWWRQKASDVTINRPNWMTYLSLAFNWYLWAYRYVWQRFQRTTPRSTPTQLRLICFYIDATTVLMDGMHHSAQQITILCIAYGHMQLRANSLFGWGRWDKRQHTGIAMFYVKIRFVTNAQHSDCGKSIPFESFYPHSSQIMTYHIKL